MISKVSEERPWVRFFEIHDECLIIESATRIVNQEIISINNDKSQCATLADLADIYFNQHELFRANEGNESNDSIAEVPVCQEKGIGALEVLGNKIQPYS